MKHFYLWSLLCLYHNDKAPVLENDNNEIIRSVCQHFSLWSRNKHESQTCAASTETSFLGIIYNLLNQKNWSQILCNKKIRDSLVTQVLRICLALCLAFITADFLTAMQGRHKSFLFYTEGNEGFTLLTSGKLKSWFAA